MNTKNLVSQFFYSQTKVLVLFISTVIFLVGLELCQVVLIKSIIDNVIVAQDTASLPLYITLFVLNFIAISGLVLFKRKQISNIIASITTNLTKTAHESILKAELSEDEKEEVKEVTNRIFDNSYAIAHEHIEKNILVLFEKALQLLALFIVLMIIKPIFCLIVFGSLPFFYLMIKAIDRFRHKLECDKNEKTEEVDKILEKTNNKIRNIKLMNGIEYEKDNIEKWSNTYIGAKERSDMMSSISESVVQDIFVATICAIVLGVGAWLAVSPDFGMTAGIITVFVILTPITFITCRQLTFVNFHFSLVDEYASELDVIYNLRTEMKGEPINIIEEIHSLKFIDVTYSTKPKENIIESISFELKRGEKLGVIADDVSKDILFEILTKLTKPNQGYVSINNCDINKINTSYLRDLITSIFDYSTVYDDTIMNNIAYPAKFDEYKYNDALNKSGLKELINCLPDKDNTIISKDNELITKDMMNRIIFANAFYKDSKIFVLNEATCDFDINTEAEVLNEIFKLKGKIVVMLTDKVYNLSRCDKILIIQNGKTVEYGKYEELLHDKNSYFYHMIKKGSVERKQSIS